jgi:Flp pilus assembly protein TadD
MIRTRLLLLLASAILVALLFMLPRVVVENESGLAPSPASEGSDPHPPTPAELQERIRLTRAQYADNQQTEKNATFADSLAGLYRRAGRYDSAAWFSARAASFFNTLTSLIKTGDLYYEAHLFATDAAQQQAFAAQAQTYFTQVLGQDPHNLEVKNKLAMTYTTSAGPMQGIRLLQEIIAEEPNNRTALFNLGMLSIQSGQYDKAVGRLEKLVAIDSLSPQGWLLLGVAYKEMGRKKEARSVFEKVKTLDTDPSVQATADSYLDDLDN